MEPDKFQLGIQQHREQQAQQADVEKQDAQHGELKDSLNNILMATMVSKDPQMIQVAEDLRELLQGISEASASFQGSSLHLLPYSNSQLAQAVSELRERIEGMSDAQDIRPYLEDLSEQVAQLSQAKPVVNVPKQEVSMKPVVDAIKEQGNKEGPVLLDNFKAQDISGDDSFQYVGFMSPSGQWYILENDINGGSFRYKFGKKNYKSSWKSHANQNYKLLDEAIREIKT